MKKKPTRYVDGFVGPVSKKGLVLYRRIASEMGKVWMKHGALQYVECVGEDLRKNKYSLHFGKMAKAKPSETVLFSYIVYKSRAHRDAVNKKVMKDPIMNDPKYKTMLMPFDMKRIAYGGFTTIVNL